MARLRFEVPPPQDREQLRKLPHDPHMQSTGHVCVLQARVSFELPRHAAPPKAEVVLMARTLTCVPPPQEALQDEKLLQLPQEQSIGHDCRLQDCVSFLLPLQGMPPLAC